MWDMTTREANQLVGDLLQEAEARGYTEEELKDAIKLIAMSMGVNPLANKVTVESFLDDLFDHLAKDKS